jgi:hypothetical protein
MLTFSTRSGVAASTSMPKEHAIRFDDPQLYPFSMIPRRRNSSHIRDADGVGVLLHIDGSGTSRD